jgi:outer membrane biosynthesis protein TonB
MTAAEMQKTASLRPDTRPLFWALVISLGVHVLLLWLLVVAGLAKTIFSTSHRLLAEMKRAEELRARTPPQPPPLMFVEVDPAQTVAEAPKDAKYYSAHSTQAANPDATTDTGAPKIDGAQTHVVQTQDNPRTRQFPLQPAPPKEAPPPEPPAEKPEPKPEPKPETPPTPGDLAMVKIPAPPKTPEQPPEIPTEHQRPLTIAEAQQRMGMKVKQDGGVTRRRQDVSLDTKGSPLGEYDERLVAVIRQHWYDLIDSHRVSLDRVGRVVVQFRLHYDGSVTDRKVLESDVGGVLSYLCEAAIQDPAPFEKWTSEMRLMIDAPYREVTFTFYYE